MRKILLSVLVLTLFSTIAIAWLSFSKTGRKIFAFQGPTIARTFSTSSKELMKLQSKANAAKTFVMMKDANLKFQIAH